MRMVLDRYDFESSCKAVEDILESIEEGKSPTDYVEDIVNAILLELGIDKV